MGTAAGRKRHGAGRSRAGRTQRCRHRHRHRHTEAALRRALPDRRGAARPAFAHHHLHSRPVAGRRAVPAQHRGGAGGGEAVRGAPRADYPVRRRFVARRPRQRAGRRHLGRHLADEPRAGGQRRRHGLHGRGRRDARGAQPSPARHRPVLPDRPGRQCEPRRHGGDAGVGHQRGALRHDARERHLADGGDGRRAGADHGDEGTQVFGRLRPDTAPDRLGRHARRDHLADGEALRHPAGDRRRGVPVPEPGIGLPGGDRDDPDGRAGGAHRAHQRARHALAQPVRQARLSGRAVPVPGVPRHRRRA